MAHSDWWSTTTLFILVVVFWFETGVRKDLLLQQNSFKSPWSSNRYWEMNKGERNGHSTTRSSSSSSSNRVHVCTVYTKGYIHCFFMEYKMYISWFPVEPSPSPRQFWASHGNVPKEEISLTFRTLSLVHLCYRHHRCRSYY
jgi:hypothetical protein